MSIRHFIPEDLQPSRILGPLLFALAAFYLGYHVVNGERGLYAYYKQSRTLEAQEKELARLQAKRGELENRVALMSDDSLDSDLLDEQARRLLGVSKESEIILLVEPDGTVK